MQKTFVLLSVLGAVAAQGVTNDIAPGAPAPAGCEKSFDGEMEITVAAVKVQKRAFHYLKRTDCGGDGILVVTLKDGVLKDAKDRTGYIASNYQFQFDGPPQAGAIYTAGFTKCANMSLALGGSTTFYQCKSGDFYNLYDRSWAAQCEPVDMIAMPCGGASSGGSSGGSSSDGPAGGASQVGDGQAVATSMVTTTIVAPISDGQPQVKTTVVPIPMCQIGDGQVQAHMTPCASIPVPGISQISDGQVQAPPTPPVITQISDGQVQAPTGTPITQISDGQVQAPTGTLITQISDGQVQAPSGTPITQISDGQVQAPSGTPITQISGGQVQAPTGTPITQISDGQVQAPSPTPITQISDGQVQAPTGIPITQISDGQVQASTGASETAASTTFAQVGANAGGRVEMGSFSAFFVWLGAAIALL